MMASYLDSEVLNECPIKVTQFLDYFCTNCCFKTLFFSKSVLPLVLTLTYQFPFVLVHPFILVHTHKSLIHSAWVKPSTPFTKRAVLRLSFV